MSTTSSLEGNYSPPELEELQYEDAPSSSYPDRPIRPLPKRRLRSRLSSGVADSILQAKGTSPSTASFQSVGKDGMTYTKDTGEDDGHFNSQQDNGQANDKYQFRGSDAGDRGINGIHQRLAPASPLAERNANSIAKHDDSRYYKQAHMPPPLPPSTASSNDSVDGYDSFENTNNKKKRKIPISGSLSNHQSSLSADMAHMDISSTRNVDGSQADLDDSVGQYYGSGSSAIAAATYTSAITNSIRGRFGRSALRRPSGRSPLGVSFNGSNTSLASHSGLNSHHKDEGLGQASSANSVIAARKSSDQGIISAAIANAAAMPVQPRGQEEVSLLEQQSFKKSSSSKTQFTFVCESNSTKGLNWPGYGYSSSGAAHGERVGTRGGGQMSSKANHGFSTQGTQTSPSMANQSDQPPQTSANQQANQQARKPRRSLAKQLALAARDRQVAQDYENYHNPPKRDKIWLCDFCEYEMIYGEPPVALIRRYETKDRNERRRVAEKRRLLEKAKMKSRKGKKGTKNNKNQSATLPQQQSQKTRYDAQSNGQGAMQSQDTQSDEQIYDDYDEDPYDAHAPDQAQPQPTAKAKNQPVRPPAG